MSAATGQIKDIREYCEGIPVDIEYEIDDKHGKRLVITAYNECGYNATSVDILDLLYWLKRNMPEVLDEVKE